MKRNFFGRNECIRLVLAAAVLLGLTAALNHVHDYPLTKRQMNLIRQGNIVAAERPWIAMFYFFNEAGSGIKFFLTGDDKYIRDYPSEEYIQSRRAHYRRQITAAHNNDWRAQVALARRYYIGESVTADKSAAVFWLREARKNAPADMHLSLDKAISEMERE